MVTLTKARSIILTLFFSSILVACTQGVSGSNDSETFATAEEIRELISGKSVDVVSPSNGASIAEERFESDGTYKSITLVQGVNIIGIGTWEIVKKADVAVIRVEAETYLFAEGKLEIRRIERETSVIIRDDQSSVFQVLSGDQTGRTPPRKEFTIKQRFDALSIVTTR